MLYQYSVCFSECGGYLTGPAGSFSYPNTPGHEDYDHQVSCAWVIRVESDKVCSLFFFFVLEFILFYSFFFSLLFFTFERMGGPGKHSSSAHIGLVQCFSNGGA